MEMGVGREAGATLRKSRSLVRAGWCPPHPMFLPNWPREGTRTSSVVIMEGKYDGGGRSILQLRRSRVESCREVAWRTVNVIVVWGVLGSLLDCWLLKRMTEVRDTRWETGNRFPAVALLWESVVREAVNRVAVKGAPGAGAALSGALMRKA